MPEVKLTPAKALSDLKKYCAGDPTELLPIWLVTHEGGLWLAANYWAFRPNPLASLIFEELWGACNLAFKAPMRIEVRLSVTERKEQDLEIAHLFPDSLGELSSVEPRPVADGMLVHESETEIPREMWRRKDGTWTVVNAEYAELLRRYGWADEWRQGADPFGRLFGFQEGSFAAIHMPLHLTDDRKLIKDPDLPPALFDLDDMRP